MIVLDKFEVVENRIFIILNDTEKQESIPVEVTEGQFFVKLGEAYNMAQAQPAEADKDAS